MEINFRKGSDCESTASIVVSEIDYKDKVEEKLKKYLKTVDIKGYRKGKVPISVLYDLYGEQIVLEESENICIDGLDEYLISNRMLSIGDYIQTNIKKDGGNLIFEYELHVIDYFDLDFLKNIEVVKYIVNSVSDRKIEDQLYDIQSEDCNIIIADRIGERSTVAGNIEFDGLLYDFIIQIQYLDKTEQEQLLNKTKGDTITLDMKRLLENEAIDYVDEENDFTDQILEMEVVNFCVQEIRDIDFEEINEEGFLDFLGVDTLPPKAELKKFCGERMIQIANISAQKLLKNELRRAALGACKVQLPEYYIKQTVASALGSYDDYKNDSLLNFAIESIRWNIIFESILEKYDLKPTDDLIVEKLQFSTIEALIAYSEETGIDVKAPQIDNFMEDNKNEIVNNALEALNEKLVFQQIENIATISIESISVEDLEKKLAAYEY